MTLFGNYLFSVFFTHWKVLTLGDEIYFSTQGPAQIWHIGRCKEMCWKGKHNSYTTNRNISTTAKTKLLNKSLHLVNVRKIKYMFNFFYLLCESESSILKEKKEINYWSIVSTDPFKYFSRKAKCKIRNKDQSTLAHLTYVLLLSMGSLIIKYILDYSCSSSGSSSSRIESQK